MASLENCAVFAFARRFPCDRCGQVTEHECLMSFRTKIRPGKVRVSEANQVAFVVTATDRYFETRCSYCNRVERLGNDLGSQFDPV